MPAGIRPSLISLFVFPNKKNGISVSFFRLNILLLLWNNSRSTDVTLTPDPHDAIPSILVLLHGGGFVTIVPFDNVITNLSDDESNKSQRITLQLLGAGVVGSGATGATTGDGIATGATIGDGIGIVTGAIGATGATIGTKFAMILGFAVVGGSTV